MPVVTRMPMHDVDACHDSAHMTASRDVVEVSWLSKYPARGCSDVLPADPNTRVLAAWSGSDPYRRYCFLAESYLYAIMQQIQ